jgi:hypothetical protein
VLARPAPDGPAPGRALDDVATGTRFLLYFRQNGVLHHAGRVSLDRALPPEADAALAFDPVRNAVPQLHPTGLVHRARGLAYPLSRRWRGAGPPAGT